MRLQLIDFISRNLVIFLLLLGFCSADAKNHLGQLPNINEQIEIDGELSESAWSSAKEVNLNFEIMPGENTPSPVKTVALIFEDGEHLFVAFKADDVKPELIRAYLTDRDHIEDTDSVGIKLDTFNDSRRAFLFQVNPLGIQSDSIIDEQLETTDDSWDAIWYSAGQITESGFIVEIKIPLNALRFESNESLKTWGIEFIRNWPREVLHEIPSSQHNRQLGCRLCQLATVQGFSDVEAPKNLTLIPSLTVGRTDQRTLNNEQGWSNGDLDTRTSLDLRWGVSENTFVNATINPDFSQIEADSVQLDVNSLSSLFLAEKRPFFQDGADYFSSWNRLIYTRVFEEPEYGIKVTGKQGGHSYGLVSIEDKHTSVLLPYEYGTNYIRLDDQPSKNHIFRYKYDLGKSGNIGTTMSYREADDYHNKMISVDGKYWINKTDYFKFQLMDSDSHYPDAITDDKALGQAEDISGSAYSLNYTHDDRNWNWYATYHHFGEDFRADTGFISYTNWKRAALGGGRTWYANQTGSWWKSVIINSAWINSREMDETEIDKGVYLNFEINAIYESAFGLDLQYKDQTYIDPSIMTSQTEFDVDSQTLWGHFKPISEVGIEAEYTWGNAIDYFDGRPGKIGSAYLAIDFQLTNQLNTEIEYIDEQLDVYDELLYSAKLTNFKLAFQIDSESFIKLTAQAQDISFPSFDVKNRRLASQLIYSYKLNPFTLFYAGYSDRFRTKINTGNFIKTDRTIFLKFSYAWQI